MGCTNNEIFPAGKGIIGVTLIEALIVLFVQCFNVLSVSELDEYTDVRRYTILYTVATIALLFFVINGILKENIFEIFAFGACAAILILYTIFQLLAVLHTSDDTSDDQLQINPGPQILLLIVTVVFPAIYTFLGWKVYLEIRWRILLKFEDNETMSRMYKIYQVFLTLLKFDTQLGGILLLTLIAFIFDKGVSAYLLIPAFILLELGGAIVAYFSSINEVLPGMVIFLLARGAQPVYLIYKLLKLSIVGRDSDEQPGADDEEKLIFYWLAGCIGLAVRVCLVVVSIKVARNFNKGLKRHLTPKTDNVEELHTSTNMNRTTYL